MGAEPLVNRLSEVTQQTLKVVRQLQREGDAAATPLRQPERIEARTAPETHRIPAPPASPLISMVIRTLIQEEARLHWHHRDLPVSRFSACMLMPG